MIHFFKKSYIYIAFASFGLLVFCFNASPNTKELDGDETKIIEQVKNALANLHYAPKTIDDKFSEQVFTKYMEDIDPYKRIFTQQDMMEFNKSKLLMDDYFTNDNVAFYEKTIDLLYKRFEEAQVVVNRTLAQPINFEIKEDYILDEDKKNYPKNKQEWEQEWAKYVKFQILNEAYSTIEVEDSAVSLKEIIPSRKTPVKREKSSNKSDIKLSKEELLTKATEKVKEDLNEFFRRAKARKKSDFFSIYVNAYAETYDPHTSYFSPKQSEDFGTNISGKFEGIGATIQDKKGYPTIGTLIIGGPAWKSKKLDGGDKILKVAQGNKEAVSVVGMALDDAIRLIKGKKGTTVNLTVQKKDGSIKNIAIVRDEIELEDSYAKSTIIVDDKGNKFGLISFPSFYMPFNRDEENGRYVSQDVKREITELKKEGVKGIILDVRFNGGGSLSEVVNMFGLFIKTGPVVQVMNSDGKKRVLSDKDPSVEWDGPLAIMVNELSASASEILAGAIQDYKRGIIIGSQQTYGKGTVQQFYPLDRFSFSNSSLGDIKLTVQKYYRVTGNSVQLKGVTSDIIMPDRFSYNNEFKESSQKTALPWDQISTSSFTPWNINYDFTSIKAKSAERLKNNNYLKMITEGSQWLEKLNKAEKVSLQYNEYMEDRKKDSEESKKYESIAEYKNKLTFIPHKNEKNIITSDTIKKAKMDDWYKNLKKDFYVEEAINVMREIK